MISDYVTDDAESLHSLLTTWACAIQNLLFFQRGGDYQLVYDFLSCSSKSHLDTHGIFWKLLFRILTFWEPVPTLISLHTWSSNTEHFHSYKLFFWEPCIYSKIEVLLIKLYYSHHVTKDASPTRAPQQQGQS